MTSLFGKQESHFRVVQNPKTWLLTEMKAQEV